MNEILYTINPTNPRVTYTREHHNMNAEQIWTAWKKQIVSVYQLETWQQLHKIYFNDKGEIN